MQGDLFEDDDDDDHFTVDPVFQEVPLELLTEEQWATIAARPWRDSSENIMVLESRALLRGVEIISSVDQLRSCRLVALSDNLPVVLCFTRRRARNFQVMTCIRKMAARCLA